MPRVKTTLLSILFYFAVCIGLVHSQKKCAERIAQLHPRQNLDMEKMLGEWYTVHGTWLDFSKILLKPGSQSCVSQVFSKQKDSSNLDTLDVLWRVNHTQNVGEHENIPGVAKISREQPAHWVKTFANSPGKVWNEVVLATDYNTYWLQFECREPPNEDRVEALVLRTRTRNGANGLPLTIYNSLVEGLGFSSANTVYPGQINCYDSYHQSNGVDSNTKQRPAWFNYNS